MAGPGEETDGIDALGVAGPGVDLTRWVVAPANTFTQKNETIEKF